MIDEKIKNNSNTLIKKSKEMARTPLTLVELNRGLNLIQQRFFNMAILTVKEDGISQFNKKEYCEIFKDDTNHFYGNEVKENVTALGTLGFLETTKSKISWNNVFVKVEYVVEESVYKFYWSPFMLEHVLNIKKNYIQQDLQVLANFKNKYSFVWYDYFKSNHRQWKWKLTREEVINLLRLEEKKSYLEKHSMLFKQCIEAPLKELNKYTEFNIECEVIKKNRNIIGYEFKRFVEKEVEFTVTPKQLEVLREIVERYGDTTAIMREIASFATIDASAIPYLTDLFFEIQSFKRYILAADSFTSDSYKDIIALAIHKDNQFKAKLKELNEMKSKTTTIYDALEDTREQQRKPTFYNWLEERE